MLLQKGADGKLHATSTRDGAAVKTSKDKARRPSSDRIESLAKPTPDNVARLKAIADRTASETGGAAFRMAMQRTPQGTKHYKGAWKGMSSH